MVALRDNIFVRLQAAIASKKKLFIGTFKTDADADIELEEIHNNMEIEQAIFENK